MVAGGAHRRRNHQQRAGAAVCDRVRSRRGESNAERSDGDQPIPVPDESGDPYYISNAPATAITPAPEWTDPPPSNYIPPNIATITTDANGVGSFDVTANALTQQQIDEVQGNRRALPSQVDVYNHDWSMDTIGQPITFLVFINTPGPSSPTWSAIFNPFFQQYANLIGMKVFISSYSVVSGQHHQVPAGHESADDRSRHDAGNARSCARAAHDDQRVVRQPETMRSSR